MKQKAYTYVFKITRKINTAFMVLWKVMFSYGKSTFRKQIQHFYILNLRNFVTFDNVHDVCCKIHYVLKAKPRYWHSKCNCSNLKINGFIKNIISKLEKLEFKNNDSRNFIIWIVLRKHTHIDLCCPVRNDRHIYWILIAFWIQKEPKCAQTIILTENESATIKSYKFDERIWTPNKCNW